LPSQKKALFEQQQSVNQTQTTDFGKSKRSSMVSDLRPMKSSKTAKNLFNADRKEKSFTSG
jgi:hypothetical protein